MENLCTYILSGENISKSFRLKNGQLLAALDSVNVGVRTGRITALVGPDGAGKSTLLRIIAGLLSYDSGSLLFMNKSYNGEKNELREKIGYMPQKFGLYEDLTVRENLDLYADLHGVSAAERRARYEELLSISAMGAFLQWPAGKLSGGMKQKLGLICTLISPPELLLLDEPTVGVDPLSRRELWEIVEKLTVKFGMSAIISTSYMDEAAKCDELVLLFEGRSLARGTPENIAGQTSGMGYLARPVRGDTPRWLQARILDVPGIVDAVPQGGNVRFVHGVLEKQQEQEIIAALRGADVRKTPPTLEDSFMQLIHAYVGNKGREPLRLFPQAAAGADKSSPKNPVSLDSRDDPIIQTEHVSRFFGGFTAVNDVSFSVRKGEVFGLLGPNGAGKTTTFRMLCGLLPASKGILRVAGVDVRKAREDARRHIGYVAQKFSLYGPLSVRENLDFFAGAYGLRGKAKAGRIAQVAADFSLEPQLDMPAAFLPGGCKQRLAMAVGLLNEPEILFLDEPTSGADPLTRRGFWKRISALADQGVTIIVTTHFMEEAEYCDRVLIQDKGVMLTLGTPANIRAEASRELDIEATMEDAFINIVEKARKDTMGEKVDFT
jgi:ABC-2 type transport system ATP-binding protein